MNELSKADAERIRTKYIQRLDTVISEIKENFQEMDFENTNKHQSMNELCEETVKICTDAKNKLEQMIFY